jgi:hypothetical protein
MNTKKRATIRKRGFSMPNARGSGPSALARASLRGGLSLPKLRQYGFEESPLRVRTRTFVYNGNEPLVGYCAWRPRDRTSSHAGDLRLGTFSAVASASERVLLEADPVVGIVFVWIAGRLHPFGHGELNASFFSGSSQLSGGVPRDCAVLFVSGVETQRLFLSTRIEGIERLLHFAGAVAR